MLALGIDLAADPSNTGAAFVQVAARCVSARVVSGPLSDAALVQLVSAADVDVVGLDAPLGWPQPFIEALVLHRERHPWPSADDPTEQRRRLSKRQTDRVVKKATGVNVLAVSADRIAAVAMRAARLQTLFGDCWGGRENRDGSGRLVEVYPAAALKQWGLPHDRYKGKDRAEARLRLVDALVSAAPWLDLESSLENCRLSDHCLDAVVSALVALAAFVGQTTLPTTADRELASIEGWIHLPVGTLDDLRERLARRSEQ